MTHDNQTRASRGGNCDAATVGNHIPPDGATWNSDTGCKPIRKPTSADSRRMDAGITASPGSWLILASVVWLGLAAPGHADIVGVASVIGGDTLAMASTRPRAARPARTRPARNGAAVSRLPYGTSWAGTVTSELTRLF